MSGEVTVTPEVELLIEKRLNEKAMSRLECERQHEALEKERKLRGDYLTDVDNDVKNLASSINGKLNKLYLFLLGTLVTTCLNLLGILLAFILMGIGKNGQ
jgi:hypothetical protein